jgi:hypothetical protein
MNRLGRPDASPPSRETDPEISLTWSGFFNPRRVHPLRSLIFFGAGAVLGLGIAGYGLFTAKGTVTHTVPSENLALVNQRPILRTDFIAQAEMQYTKPFADTTLAERLRVLDDMIREELFVQRGLELDFPSNDPDTRAALVSAVEQQVVSDVTTHVPSDRELEAYYNENRQKYFSDGSMAFHFLVLAGGKMSDADAVAKLHKAADALRSGVTADDVRDRYGLVERVGGRGGSPGEERFYWAVKFNLGDAFLAQAQALDSGEVSEPFSAGDSVGVVQMMKHVRPAPLSFQKARRKVLSDFDDAAKKRLEAADEKYLRSKADILVADDYAADYQKHLDEKNPQSAKPAAAQFAAGNP